MTISLIYVLIAIFFSAFFSGMEIAFISANRLKIELEKKQGDFSAKILSSFIQKPASFIGAMLIGNNIALVVYSIMMSQLLEPHILVYTKSETVVLLVQTLISTLIVLFFAEFLPKALLRINPNFALKVAAIPLKLIYLVLFPFTYVTSKISNGILFLFKVDTSNSSLAFTKVDLVHFVMDIPERQESRAE
ncbi:MAG: DUF21 domain-containing protein, partial [Flavobacteriales bacterium]|nr:DUF21 domain-containing protein [Flavobacteriales bacterium]